MLKEKETDDIVGFLKIAYINDYYEIYDVCRLNPTKRCKIQNQMCIFMKKSIKLFFENFSDENKKPKIILAIDKKNKYYSFAKNLYNKVGFEKTNPVNMKLLENDWINYRYYVFVFSEIKK